MMKNDTPIYVNNTQIENFKSCIYMGQIYNNQRHKPRQGDSKKNYGRIDSIRQAPRHLQG
ncbi:hypothetical protein NP493_1184g00003 [Ridgeia piscesae]|uniref:Uncharacterized protein n=1 Tax=Ridgeia piscesae TaxID=27915 RepID=A0AAD9KEA7_RIDPI|nr:hypothetical protein NP493_1184g00003 [Ridgeia piscesae]